MYGGFGVLLHRFMAITLPLCVPQVYMNYFQPTVENWCSWWSWNRGLEYLSHKGQDNPAGLEDIGHKLGLVGVTSPWWKPSIYLNSKHRLLRRILATQGPLLV